MILNLLHACSEVLMVGLGAVLVVRFLLHNPRPVWRRHFTPPARLNFFVAGMIVIDILFHLKPSLEGYQSLYVEIFKGVIASLLVVRGLDYLRLRKEVRTGRVRR